MKTKQRAAGVGIAIGPASYEAVTRDGGRSYDFLEFDPDAFYITDHVVAAFTSLADRFPFVMHTTSLSICGDRPLDPGQLARIARFAELTNCDVYSDHLAFTRAGGVNLDLYMAPVMNEASLDWLARRVAVVCDAVGVPFGLENVGILVDHPANTFGEPAFIAELLDRTDAQWQLNLDSVAVGACTLGREPMAYLAEFPLDRVSTIAIVPEDSMNSALRRRYGHGLDALMFDMLTLALARSSCDRVIVQGRAGDTTEKFDRFYARTRALYQEARPA